MGQGEGLRYQGKKKGAETAGGYTAHLDPEKGDGLLYSIVALFAGAMFPGVVLSGRIQTLVPVCHAQTGCEVSDDVARRYPAEAI